MKTRYHAPALAAFLSLLTGVGCHTVQARAAFKDGNRFYKEENWRRAIEQYEKALAHHPNDAKNLYAIANLYEKFGKIQEAEDTYKKVSELNPKDTKACGALAAFYN